MEGVLGGSGSPRRGLGGHMVAVLEVSQASWVFEVQNWGHRLALEVSFEGCLERNHCPGGTQGGAG